MSEALAVLRVGMACPVGLDAAQTTSSIRAGVTRKSESSLCDSADRPIVLGHLADAHLRPLSARLPDLDRRPGRTEIASRLLRLAGAPLAETLSHQFAGLSLPLVLATDAAALGPEHDHAEFLASLATQAKVRLTLDASRVVSLGGVGLYAALIHARDQLLATGRAKFVLVGGVDSYVDAERLATLERAGRLRTQGPQDAFTPGEAAAFVLLSTESVCRQHSLMPLAWITGVALADAAHQPRPTEGLAAACGTALASLRAGEQIQTVVAGLNGESRSATEWGVTTIRNREHLAEPLQLEHPAEYIGDAGAALAPLMVGVTALQLRAQLLLGPALVWACADGGQRGALLMYAGG